MTLVSASVVRGSRFIVSVSGALNIKGVVLIFQSTGGVGIVLSTNLFAKRASRMALVLGSIYLIILRESYSRYMASDP